ncbi:hypothetical protein N480_21895 [Pseudoalteromonas luteoviolacea S2607]|uniref:hypothetical protein n=1 Tax=Pseudoalteromonas luteoviolacea TaxID=43657 RepID=UPI0007B06767|nr:hypothetical protein [Pseudoalteromonas luteoviolacea]KZN34259.1 hypothetical protein N480_21895 [Pseudoalteromonas luteoviolacea S2607]
MLANSHIKVLGLHQGELVQLAKYNMTKFTKEQDSQHFSFHHQACGFVSTIGAYELSVILYEEHIEEPPRVGNRMFMLQSPLSLFSQVNHSK